MLPTQQLIKKGFEYLCIKLFKIIKENKYYKFKFEYQVTNIDYKR